jgi:CRP-like cAMP-binding protein
LSQAEILSNLRDAPLFQGVEEQALRNLAQRCSVRTFEVGEPILTAPDDDPILLVAKGCVSATSTTGYGKFEKIVLALLMPTQLLYEFEFFGNKPPENAGLRAVDGTEIIFFPRKAMAELCATYPQVMHNLAKALITKINVCNFHLEAVSQTKGGRKIATMLSGFVKIPEWRPRHYQDIQRRSPMPLSIVWDVELFTKYLSSDFRTIREGLFDLVQENLIEIEWLERDLVPIQNVGAGDIKELKKTGDRIDTKTYFRITLTNPGKLEDYCAD